MPLGDVQAMPNDFINLVLSETQCDRMWSYSGRQQGIRVLSKYKFFETMPLGLSLLDVPTGFEWGSHDCIEQALVEISSYGESARWTLPTLRGYLNTWATGSDTHTKLVNAINSIEAATTSPTITYLKAAANRQVVTTAASSAKAITLTGSSVREPSVSFAVLTQPSHGTLTGTAPNLIYTPNAGYTGPDHFTFRTADTLTTSEPATVGIVVGTAGNGLKGEYFDNSDFTNPVLTRTDPQVNFDWGTGSPHASINADTFSVRWSGLLLVPETCAYTFSALSNDGVRLYINGIPAIDNFVDQNSKWKDSAPIQLTKGQLVEIQMDYYENTASAAAKLKWTGPSVAGMTGAIIPQAYLFDGTGMTRTPYAFAQSLTMLKNHSQAIILAGSSGTMSYSIVTPPAHGTLTGTAPNLTYTPFANYIGLDSFTFKVNNGTSDSAPATVSIEVIPANTFGVNFYAYGALTTPEAQANLLVSPGMSAGLADWFTYGWINIEVPWGLSSPQPPATLTSNRGNTAAFVFKSCRNGGPYNWSTPRTTLLGDGNGNMMDGHVNSTLDGPYLFDMEVTGIPFAVYDVIFYIGANQAQFGTGTGVIKFNGGADRAFTLKPGAFNGTFIEMVNATTQGNYIVFSGVTGSSFTAQTWGTGTNGFNHIGPCGFQIREAVVGGDTTTTLVSSPAGTGSYGEAVTFTATVGASGVPATGTVTFRADGAVLGTGVLSGGTASFTTSTLTVANHSITATYDGSGSFGGSVSSPMTYVVTPRAVTVTGVTAGNKIYDGNASAALTGGAVSGVIGGETATLVPGSGTFASPNAGTWAVTASGYSLAGPHAGNYTLAAQPTVPNATITPRPVVLTATRTYDRTATAAAGIFNISNNLDDANLTLGGSVTLADKNAGSQTLQPVHATPVRVQSATGSTGSTASTTVAVDLDTSPLAGNTLIAVISTRGTTASRVSGISGGGVTWTRVYQADNSSGTTTEIWYGPDVSNGTTAIAIAQASLRSAAVVMEYSGLLTPTSFDLAANSSGSGTAAVTGTTGMTSQANELLIGGISIADGRRTLNAPFGNEFTVIASPRSGGANADAMIYALEKIVSAPVEASTGGTVSAPDAWSGAIATFKAATSSSLSLSGSAAANYTLAGMTGSVTITPKSLTTTGLTASNRAYDGTTAATLTGTATLLADQEPGSGSTSDGKPYTGDTVTLEATATGTFADKHVATHKPVTVTGLTLGGAQAGNYTLIHPAGLTADITPLPITVTAVTVSKTYDGTTTADGMPTLSPSLAPGDSTTLLEQSFQNPGAETGKTILPAIAIDDGNGGANYEVTYVNNTGTIEKAAATVTLENLSATYDGSPKPVTALTEPSGLTTEVTYDGSPAPPTDPGSYAVAATVTEPNHTGTTSDTLVIIADPMTTWRSAHFTALEIENGLADDTADPEGDGFTNREEYVLGTDPRAFTAQPLAIDLVPENQFTLTFTARRATGTGYAGLTRKYTVESSATLGIPESWQPVTGHTGLVGASQTKDITGDDQTVIVTLPDSGPAKFHRLSVRVE
ncbi:MAG TPA: YDG domain-containing protein [Luteolibacter sp.]|nr:YDG domain-containing protein [Luteolibacter sp.]